MLDSLLKPGPLRTFPTVAGVVLAAACIGWLALNVPNALDALRAFDMRLLPVLLALVVAYPTIAALRQSLYGEPGLDPATGFISDTEPYVGLDNYKAVFQGDTAGVFWNGM